MFMSRTVSVVRVDGGLYQVRDPDTGNCGSSPKSGLWLCLSNKSVINWHYDFFNGLGISFIYFVAYIERKTNNTYTLINSKRRLVHAHSPLQTKTVPELLEN